MASQSVPVEKLQNVGPTIAKRLKTIGIRTSDDLRAVGPVDAFCRLRAKYAGITIPVCYYLYSLEGALRDQLWGAIGSDVKRLLLKRVSERAVRSRRPAGGKDDAHRSKGRR